MSLFREKIKKIANMFCTSQVQQKQKPKKYKNKSKVNIQKKARNKFIFENTIIKLSRRNVGQQQFFQSQVLTLQLQQYLAQRVSSCTTAIMKGQFTLSIFKKLVKPMIIRDKPFISEQENKMGDVICTQGFIIKTSDKVDLVLIQIYNGENNENQFKIVQSILKHYHKVCQKIVLICSQNISLGEYSPLFKLYSRNYLFDIERVMQNQKVVCNIIWASKQISFLRIQKDSLVDFYTQKLTLFKTQHKIAQELLTKLVDLDIHLQMARILQDVQMLRQKIDDLFKAFVFELYTKQEKTRDIIQQYFEVDSSCPETPVLPDFTPGFRYMTTVQKRLNQSHQDFNDI